MIPFFEFSFYQFLLVMSSAGTGIAHLCLGTYTLLVSLGCPLDGYGWIPLLSFSLVMFFASCGILSIPFYVVAEILPLKVKYLIIYIFHNILTYLPCIISLFMALLSSTDQRDMLHHTANLVVVAVLCCRQIVSLSP